MSTIDSDLGVIEIFGRYRTHRDLQGHTMFSDELNAPTLAIQLQTVRQRYVRGNSKS